MGPGKHSRARSGKQSTSFRSMEVETCPQERPAHRRELCLHQSRRWSVESVTLTLAPSFSQRGSQRARMPPDSSLQGWAPRAQRDAGKERTNLKQQIKSSQLKGKHGAKITPVKFLMSY